MSQGEGKIYKNNSGLIYLKFSINKEKKTGAVSVSSGLRTLFKEREMSFLEYGFNSEHKKIFIRLNNENKGYSFLNKEGKPRNTISAGSFTKYLVNENINMGFLKPFFLQEISSNVFMLSSNPATDRHIDGKDIPIEWLSTNAAEDKAKKEHFKKEIWIKFYKTGLRKGNLLLSEGFLNILKERKISHLKIGFTRKEQTLFIETNNRGDGLPILNSPDENGQLRINASDAITQLEMASIEVEFKEPYFLHPHDENTFQLSTSKFVNMIREKISWTSYKEDFSSVVLEDQEYTEEQKQNRQRIRAEKRRISVKKAREYREFKAEKARENTELKAKKAEKLRIEQKEREFKERIRALIEEIKANREERDLRQLRDKELEARARAIIELRVKEEREHRELEEKVRALKELRAKEAKERKELKYKEIELKRRERIDKKLNFKIRERGVNYRGTYIDFSQPFVKTCLNKEMSHIRFGLINDCIVLEPNKNGAGISLINSNGGYRSSVGVAYLFENIKRVGKRLLLEERYILKSINDGLYVANEIETLPLIKELNYEDITWIPHYPFLFFRKEELSNKDNTNIKKYQLNFSVRFKKIIKSSKESFIDIGIDANKRILALKLNNEGKGIEMLVKEGVHHLPIRKLIVAIEEAGIHLECGVKYEFDQTSPNYFSAFSENKLDNTDPKDLLWLSDTSNDEEVN
ncbi:hypothetical protein [Priestia megaterium]|uniref:Uncharacterized protein n=1 Tax=Priestia megaterium TaxID=1404 RepID=A0A6M6E3Z4_PRIMG|nr:hypothetical protein [Priestia megaterium]QJX80334.1 hypothetical protein FDZ14_30050 [Priestia megaterium]